MLRFYHLIAAVAVLFATTSTATCAEPSKPWSLRRMLTRQDTPYWVGNPKQVVAMPPAPIQYTEHSAPGSPAWSASGTPVPTYNWGFFGARYQQPRCCHKGYYGDTIISSRVIGY